MFFVVGGLLAATQQQSPSVLDICLEVISLLGKPFADVENPHLDGDHFCLLIS
jgi:hypothetical protein